ncbi:MAG: dethiobiotin synthase [Methylomonas sp.]|jgi:dethiobiotin synthetase|uniref:dethiobiotin synthase n=1 Tax=Methylomonas sp. TaxID=418 RepID=UPI0025F15898|nr:dethiobiotin synthase [Methylomonas sp.]MCK9606482.1 dethiobiotin synthase [Methylomonas sp.]
MSSGFFVTGTDTNVGKTWSTLALMRALQRQGLSVNGMKPVAAGCEWLQGGWRNSDALLLQQYASRALDYRHINPYAFQPSVSPHIACGNTDVRLDVILNAYRFLKTQGDCVLVEGAGGWFSPLCRAWDNAYLAVALQLPIILVVGVRLGCINHALLTYRAIQQSGCELAGWLAVLIDKDMPEFQANLDFLKQRIGSPLLGVLPHLPSPDFAYLAALITLPK